MNTHEVARLMEAIVNGMGDVLKDPAKKGLSAVASFFRQYPDRSVKEFTAAIEKAFAAEGSGVSALAERITAFREGRGEPFDAIWKSIENAKAGDLQAVLKALKQKSARTKDANKATLRSFMLDGKGSAEAPAEATVNPAGGATNGDADEGYREYCLIRDELPRLSVGDVRNRFEAIRRLSKEALEEVAHRLGYSFMGSKEEVAQQLLSTLEAMKVSQVRTDKI